MLLGILRTKRVATGLWSNWTDLMFVDEFLEDKFIHCNFTTVKSPHHAGHSVGAAVGVGGISPPFPGSVSTGSFTSVESQKEINTFTKSATTQTFQPANISQGVHQTGSTTSSSQRSDESEVSFWSGNHKIPRTRSQGYRSTSLPRKSSEITYQQNSTMPNIQSQDDTAPVGDKRLGAVILPKVAWLARAPRN